jgi:galactose mutarotase-like enzyme
VNEQRLENIKNLQFKIETFKTKEENEVSYSVERGGIITGIGFNKDNKIVQVLYLDQETFNNPNKNVRGGVPVLFPYAGPMENLLQHGFARTKKWKSENYDNGFIGTLKSDDSTKETYPYDFILKIGGKFEEDGSFSITQSVENLEKDKEMPVSFGLHPYFKVAHDLKKDIKFDFEGGKLIEEQVEVWSNDGTTSIDNPGVPMRIKIPGLDVLILNVSKEYKKIWIWSKPGEDFICIEPVMRNEGGIINDPEMIKPGDIYSASFNIKLEK